MNEFMVVMQGETVVIMRSVPLKLTREQAVNLAAWLTVVADPSGTNLKAKILEIMQ